MRTFPDNDYRQYDERYAGQAAYKSKHEPLWNKAKQEKKASCFTAANFQLADDHNHCTCPASKRLYRNDRGHAPEGVYCCPASRRCTGLRACERRDECLCVR